MGQGVRVYYVWGDIFHSPVTYDIFSWKKKIKLISQLEVLNCKTIRGHFLTELKKFDSILDGLRTVALHHGKHRYRT